MGRTKGAKNKNTNHAAGGHRPNAGRKRKKAQSNTLLSHFRSSQPTQVQEDNIPTQVQEDNTEVPNESEEMESAINNAEMPNPSEEREDLVLNEKWSSVHADINAFQNSYRTKYEENFDSAGCMDSDESDDDNSSASDAEDSTKNAEGK